MKPASIKKYGVFLRKTNELLFYFLLNITSKLFFYLYAEFAFVRKNQLRLKLKCVFNSVR